MQAGSLYAGGFLLLWIPEVIFCPAHPWIERLKLHAWFHLTSAVAPYVFLLFAVYFRYAVLRRGPALTWQRTWSVLAVLPLRMPVISIARDV